MTISLATQIELYPGTEIVEFDSSGCARTYRVETADGRHFQINEKLYELLECLRVPASIALLAERFQQRTGEAVALGELQQLSARLEEQGVILRSGEAPQLRAPASPHARSLLALHYHRDLVSAQALAPFVRLLEFLFTRPVAAVMVAMVAAVHGLVYLQVGFPPNLQMENVNWPLFYSVMLASFVLHELGHLAACRRWRCPHGPLGFGMYFFNPVFYVNVTAAWRLNRRQRAILDLGGVYVQLVFVCALAVFYWLLHDNTFLLAVLLTDILVLSNCEPFMKLDGYWLLSDLTGVPNLHARTMEIVHDVWLSLLRRLGGRSAVPPTTTVSAQWSPLVRTAIFTYVALSVLIWPIVLLALIPMLVDAVTSYPALWATALIELHAALLSGDMAAALAQFRVLFLPTLVLLNLAFLLKRIATRLARRCAGAVGESSARMVNRRKVPQI